ncbi:MAG: dNTP triphosphohydrolase [Planctomycetaceae bacterium]|nr:MAG: dNTP triphosphohydrolase [Planctomycetaceae bacterium]
MTSRPNLPAIAETPWALDAGRVAERELWLLASYAFPSRDSAGRVHPEVEHPYRGPFARDRDRVLHCSAFRRLSGKMQVFTGEMGEYHRTRLTHTFEVASVARTIARALRLNEDLTETLALLHDIGHPPYGHCGEDLLAAAMEGNGGFSHNQFALTIVTELEQRFTDFAGLNLSHEVLGGQDTRAHKAEAAIGRAPLLEVQVVDLADSIAYDSHDVDDALQMGLIDQTELRRLGLIRRALEGVRKKSGELPPSRLRQALVHELVDLQVGDLLWSASETLRACQGLSAEEIRGGGVRLGHSPEVAAERMELESYLFDAVYRHPRLMSVRRAAGDRLRRLFDGLVANPERLPLRFRTRANQVGVWRAVSDYLAGMTDRFCDSQHLLFTQQTAGPLTDW